MPSSPIAAMTDRPQVIQPTDSERTHHGSTSSGQINDIRSPVSTIAVLPSSLPEFHQAYMKGHPKPPIPTTTEHPHETSSPSEQSNEQKAATARRLKPHSRSPGVEKGIHKPEAMTPLPSKKPRPTKWQFGIRSRNQPAEAMLAIYKALRAMGADWEVPRTRKPGGGSRSRSRSRSRNSRARARSRSRSESRSRSSSASSQSSNYRERPSSQTSSGHSASPAGREPLSVRNSTNTPSPSRGRQRRHYNQHNDWGYSIPEDPWVINARFKKEGMFPPGVLHPSSTHSSHVDLQESANLRRRSSTNTSQTSLNADAAASASFAGPGSGQHGEATDAGGRAGEMSKYPEADEAVWVYVSIQLYSIERDFFLVDFKCAGYERLVHNLIREIKTVSAIGSANVSVHGGLEDDDFGEDAGYEWRRLGDGESFDGASDVGSGKGTLREREVVVGAGRAQGEKRATSPFPFLDVASRLIIQLAEGD